MPSRPTLLAAALRRPGAWANCCGRGWLRSRPGPFGPGAKRRSYRAGPKGPALLVSGLSSPHLREHVAELLELFAVLRPISVSLRFNGTIVVSARTCREPGEIRRSAGCRGRT